MSYEIDNKGHFYYQGSYADMDHIATVFFQTKEIIAATFAHFITKAFLTVVTTVTAFLFGEENYEMLLFLGVLIVIDLMTGMIASISRGQPIESRKAFKTATKSVVYLSFFSAAYMTHQIVPYSDFIKTGVLSFLAITELLSVMENMAKMGYSMPAKLLNQIKDRAGFEIDKDEVEKNQYGNGKTKK